MRSSVEYEMKFLFKFVMDFQITLGVEKSNSQTVSTQFRLRHPMLLCSSYATLFS